jgi:pectate lyase
VGNRCITLQYVSNVIIHIIHVHNCKPPGNNDIRVSPTHVGWRGRSDGDGSPYSAPVRRGSTPTHVGWSGRSVGEGISIFGARQIWIDHCSLSYSTDGGMQDTIAFNHFGEEPAYASV